MDSKIIIDGKKFTPTYIHPHIAADEDQRDTMLPMLKDAIWDLLIERGALVLHETYHEGEKWAVRIQAELLALIPQEASEE
jgi:hypothetical protein